MLTVVMTNGSTGPEVLLSAEGEGHSSTYTFADCAIIPAGREASEEIESLEECDPGPSPIMPEANELYWGAGAFVVLAILMRVILYPRVRRGMDARYQSIRDAYAEADSTKAGAQSEVAAYESALAGLKAEATARIDAARATLEGERSASLADANARIAARREQAAAAAAQAQAAARGDVGAAVAAVASRTVEVAIGRTPDAAVVASAVESAMSVGVSS